MLLGPGGAQALVAGTFGHTHLVKVLQRRRMIHASMWVENLPTNTCWPCLAQLPAVSERLAALRGLSWADGCPGCDEDVLVITPFRLGSGTLTSNLNGIYLLCRGNVHWLAGMSYIIYAVFL